MNSKKQEGCKEADNKNSLKRMRVASKDDRKQCSTVQYCTEQYCLDGHDRCYECVCLHLLTAVKM